MQAAPTTHSRLGIYSFILSLLAPLLFMLVVFMTIMGMFASVFSGNLGKLGDLEILVAAGFFIVPLMWILSLVLGVIGFVQKTHKKTFALMEVLISPVSPVVGFLVGGFSFG